MKCFLQCCALVLGLCASAVHAQGIQVTAVRAEHSSVYVWNNPATSKAETHPGGEPIGGNFTMDPADEFRKAMEGASTRIFVPRPGEKQEF